MKIYWSAFALGAFFLAGLYVVGISPRSIIELPAFSSAANSTQAPISRDPAAIRKNYDFSMLEGTALEVAGKQRLITGAKLIEEANEIGVELGHFVVKGDGGQKSFACEKYSQLTLIFSGEGQAVSGELPSMEVEGACVASADINSISPLMIPVGKILGETVAEGEFTFREGRPTTIRFAHVSDQWPMTWHLQGIRLSDKASGQEMSVGAEELRQVLSKPLILTFKK